MCILYVRNVHVHMHIICIYMHGNNICIYIYTLNMWISFLNPPVQLQRH